MHGDILLKGLHSCGYRRCLGTDGFYDPRQEKDMIFKDIITLKYYYLRLLELIENCLNGESEVELRYNYIVPLGICPLLLNLIRNR